MDILHSLSQWIAQYGGAAFFPLMFVNGLCIPFIPAESLLLAGSILAAKGKINFIMMLISAFSGSVLGSMIGYFIGRCGGVRLVRRIISLFHIDPKKFTRLEAIMRDKGIYFIIIARFLPIAREMNGLIGGSVEMPFGRYMAGNCIGALLWVLAWGVLPYFFDQAL